MGELKEGRIAAVEGPRADEVRASAMHGARGLAACTVVLLHAGIFSATFIPGTFTAEVWRHFDSAVPVFFALSGFLLYSPFAAAHAKGKAAPRYVAYAVRRGLRIFPAYWTVLIATMVVYSAFDIVTSVSNTPGSAGEGVSWFGLFALWGDLDGRADRAVPQAWTLDVELAFYLVLPAVAAGIAWLVRRGTPWLRAELLGLGVFAACSILWKVVNAATGGLVTVENTFIGWPVSYFDGFAIGMALAVIALWDQTDPASIPAWLRRALSATTIWAAWALLLAGTLLFLQADDPGVFQKIWSGPRFLAEYTAYIGLGALLVAPVLLGWGPVGAVRRVLSTRPILHLGTVSYGIYLWHFFVFDVVTKAGLDVKGGYDAYVVWVLVGLAGSIAVATVSWKLVEEPALRLKRFFPLRTDAAAAGTSIGPAVPAGQPAAVAVGDDAR
ncbi:acyltransferase [Conexibacter sp. SYSU D00693]|uniref:acyltransferase family protein n=1 Tax=Conexibacter sp. SYSU D00693 TaxID=2812560 RepID=UPI00196AA002|nr:acyltransferase [Conexibacter sp. SYSU D00693]